MRVPSEDIPWWYALKIAGLYGVGGIGWILFSDRLLYTVISSESQRAIFQSVKGIIFVLLSSLLLFFLVGRTVHRQITTKQKLEVALQQAERLHRILRHNLRNSCQIIAGNAELLDAQVDGEKAERLAAIREQNDRLIRLSRKSIYLRDFLDITTDYQTTLDLVAAVQKQLKDAREEYPTVTITVECPAQARVHAHKYIDEAVEELLDNAIRHNDAADPRVWVGVQKDEEIVRLTVADNGPGIPPVERLVLERKTETPTEHSQGLGLWFVHLTVRDSNGTLTVTDRDEGGTEIQVTVPAA